MTTLCSHWLALNNTTKEDDAWKSDNFGPNRLGLPIQVRQDNRWSPTGGKGGIRMTRLWFTTIVCVIGLGLIIQANIAHAKLEDILYEKGTITKEEWLKTKADYEKKSHYSTTPHQKMVENSASGAIPSCAITTSPTIKN
jgi:hypothetical protein